MAHNRPSLHRALQLELGRDYRGMSITREYRSEPAAGRDPYLPGHESSLTFRLSPYLRLAFRTSCYRRGIPYTERIRQLMLADLAEHPVE